MKVRVLKEFKDSKENILRKVGEEFITNKKRFSEIVEKLKKYEDTNWVEEVKEDK